MLMRLLLHLCGSQNSLNVEPSTERIDLSWGDYLDLC